MKSRYFVVMGTAIFLLAASVGSVPAAQGLETAPTLSLSDPIGLITALAPDSSESANKSASLLDDAGTVLRLPEDIGRSASTVSLGSGRDDVAVTLPLGAQLASGGRGLLSYSTENPDVKTYASATSTGTALLVGIANADAPIHYSFDFHFPDDTVIVPDAEGGYDIDLPGEIDGHIFPAWAKDASGKDLRSEYSWDGSTLTQSVALEEASAFPVLADPAWSYTRDYAIGSAQPGTARAVMHNCFNCLFPVEGAPREFPTPGQLLPLVVRPAQGLPALNFNCIFRDEIYYPPQTGDMHKWGFVFDATPGHVDGKGSWISFVVRDKPIRSGERNWVLTVYGSIVNQNPVGIGNDAYVLLASANWQKFADNLAQIP